MKFAAALVALALSAAGCSWDWDRRDSRRQDAATEGSVLPDGGPPWVPTTTTTWQIQLTSPVDTTVEAALYEIDLDEDPSTVTTLHTAGRHVVCNFSAGTFEQFRHDGASFPAAVRGNAVSGSSGESWLDVTNMAVRTAMVARIARAAGMGCDAVDPENVDGTLESTGFSITVAQQVDYDTFLADTAHARGMSVALSEAASLVPMLASAFDWGRTVSCVGSGDCANYASMMALGKAVLDVEQVAASMRTSVCAAAATAGVDAILKPSGFGAERVSCL